MLKRWPKFLDLHTELPDTGEVAALLEMRATCPGKDAAKEEIGQGCRERSFRTPYWQGKTARTDIPERVLSPAEADMINDKYLEFNSAFHAKSCEQNARVAIAEAEQNLEIEGKLLEIYDLEIDVQY